MNVSVNRIVSALGGEALLNRTVRHEFDLMAVAEAGLPIESLLFLQQSMGFTNKAMSHILAISESTYQRRIRDKAKLTKDEGEKAISLSEVYQKGLEVFDNQADLTEWLYADIASLQGKKPVDLLDSMVGRRQVMNVLNAILHGIYL